MPIAPDRLEALARTSWCTPGETLAGRVIPGGHLGSTVAAGHRAPHRPYGPVPAFTAAHGDRWPLPTPPVAEGHVRDDEWAHDPAIWGWAHADRPEALAVRLADLLTAGRGEAVLLLGTHRIAVALPEPPHLTVWHEAPTRELHGLRALGLTTATGPRTFLAAMFTDGSRLCWANPAAKDDAITLRGALGAVG